MKSLVLALVAVALLAGAGCHHGGRKHAGGPAGPCGDGACGNGACGAGGCGIAAMHARHADKQLDTAPTAGPATGAVAYPYYTTRGPRDFLNPNPPSIGY